MIGIKPYKERGRVVGIEWRETKEIEWWELFATILFVNLVIGSVAYLITTTRR